MSRDGKHMLMSSSGSNSLPTCTPDSFARVVRSILTQPLASPPHHLETFRLTQNQEYHR